MQIDPSAARSGALVASALRPRWWEFRAFFETYRPVVLARLRKLGVPRADQNDLCQDVFVVLHRRLDGYDGAVPMRSWVEAICDRAAARFLRRAALRRARASGAPVRGSFRSVPADQDRVVDTRRACARAEVLLESLDEEKRKVFVMYELEGLHMYEVVDELGCPLQTGYSRLRAARKIIRAQLLRSRLGRPKSE